MKSLFDPKGKTNIKKREGNKWRLSEYPGIFSKTAVFAIVILALAFATPVVALSVSNSNFWDYGGIAYGYSVNLQSDFYESGDRELPETWE